MRSILCINYITVFSFYFICLHDVTEILSVLPFKHQRKMKLCLLIKNDNRHKVANSFQVTIFYLVLLIYTETYDY